LEIVFTPRLCGELPSVKCLVMKRALILLVCASAFAADHPGRTYLRDWQIQSACKVAEKGAVVSTTAFKPQGWTSAKAPTTVLAAQLAAGEFDKLIDHPADDRRPKTDDIYYGMNLRKIPGTNYPIGRMYATLPMTDDSPYKCAWWYRIEFPLPSKARAG